MSGSRWIPQWIWPEEEFADVILLEKDLGVLEHGAFKAAKTLPECHRVVIELDCLLEFREHVLRPDGERFLPFLPMAALQLLLLNLIYDFACIGIPWDNVDSEVLLKPRCWKSDSLSRFMIWMSRKLGI